LLSSPSPLRSSSDREATFEKSLEQLAATPTEKIIFLQISDAYKVSPPLEDKTIDDLRPRGRWSHDYRPAPFQGGYLPVVEVTRAVLKTGFRGTLSMEIFDGGEKGEGKEVALGDFATDSMLSMIRLLDEAAKEEE
jgi:sugar phosphate isomerase/epimerase